MALTSGTRLGLYEIRSPLGAGDMGKVYRPRDERLKREITRKLASSKTPAPLERSLDAGPRLERGG